jgi:hypothetical protein
MKKNNLGHIEKTFSLKCLARGKGNSLVSTCHGASSGSSKDETFIWLVEDEAELLNMPHPIESTPSPP